MSSVIKAGQIKYRIQRASPVPLENPPLDDGDQARERPRPPEQHDLDQLLAGAEIIRQARLDILAQMQRIEKIALERAQSIAQEEALLDARVAKAVRDGEAQGFQVGFERGFAEGRQEGLSALQAVVETIENARRSLQEKEKQLLAQFQKDIAVLAVALAEKLIARNLQEDEETTLAILNSLLPQAEGSTKTVIRLPTEIYEAFHEEIRTIHSSKQDSVGVVTFVADPMLSRGDVMIETDWGLIDGRLRSRWRRILEGLDLRGEIHGEGAGGGN